MTPVFEYPNMIVPSPGIKKIVLIKKKRKVVRKRKKRKIRKH